MMYNLNDLNNIDFFYKKIDKYLWNKDLQPITKSNRIWSKWTIGSVWASMCISITVYMLASSLISNGLNWWQALITIIVGNIIILIPLIMMAHPGPKYGIPFPVLIRSCFGIEGAKIIAMLRAFIACGWCGIQTCLAGKALYTVMYYIFPFIKNKISSNIIEQFLGINIYYFICICIIVLIQIFIIRFGMNFIGIVELISAPLLLIFGIYLIIWAYIQIGSIEKLILSFNKLATNKTVNFWHVFWPGLTAVIAYWSPLTLNISDLTRFVKSQKDQIIGQSIVVPIFMTIFSFVGIAVTCATLMIFGEIIWDPIEVIKRFDNIITVLIPMFFIIIAIICCNIPANIVSSANDFANLIPKYINFKIGAYITSFIGIIIFPWKLISDPHSYIFTWLIAYGSLLGGVVGIMIVDYFIIRKTTLSLIDLFKQKGIYTYYKGWNIIAFIALFCGILPNIPGFLMKINIIHCIKYNWIISLYDYSWFISFAISFISYLILTKLFNNLFSIPKYK